jgi:ATP-dependent helicase/nuclease subunit B
VFQLPAYAAAARAGFGDASTVVHAEYSLMRRGDFARPGFAADGGVDVLVRDRVAHVVDGIESGFYPNLPERPGFRIFVSCEYCEPDHLGTAELWSRWQRKRRDPRLAPWFGDPPADDEGGAE